MEKERKRQEKLAAKKAKREAKEAEELAELERLTNPNASPEDNQETKTDYFKKNIFFVVVSTYPSLSYKTFDLSSLILTGLDTIF